MTNTILSLINSLIAPHLEAKAREFVANAEREIQAGVSDARFTALISLASRHIPKRRLEPSIDQCTSAQAIMPGWSPQDWGLLEAVRVVLILVHPELTQPDFSERFNRWFNYADEGELCAFYRAIPLIPEPQRLVWRAAEGCRTNMKSVFMAVACDSPFPAQCFDDIAWNQMLVKALFTETPLWRVYGLDRRLSTTLAHMVLDYMEERSSAGRDLPLDVWLCLGMCRDPRVDHFIQEALNTGSLKARCATVMALGRGQHHDRLQQLLSHTDDAPLQAAIRQALRGEVDQYAFHTLLSQRLEA